ncbi:hypothetical protein Gotur_028666 [Gossypium turneri]
MLNWCLTGIFRVEDEINYDICLVIWLFINFKKVRILRRLIFLLSIFRCKCTIYPLD